MCASRVLLARHIPEPTGNVASYSAHAACGSRCSACCSMQRRSSEPQRHLGVFNQPEAKALFGDSSSQRSHSPLESFKCHDRRACVSECKWS
eukprot:6205557-Pleurochrysis_carterae.AAC.2